MKLPMLSILQVIKKNKQQLHFYIQSTRCYIDRMEDILPGIIGGSFLVILVIFIYKVIKNVFSIKPKQEFYDSKRVSSLKCLDGHIVKSKGELIIDNYLTTLGIDHIYEKTIKIKGNNVKCDWQLPEIDVYIEYWGYSSKKYNRRKNEKLRLYKMANKKLISIEYLMFDDIYSNLDRMLKKIFNLKDSKKIFIPKYCNYCGMELDNRYQLF